jgi:hypothetical protein
MKLCGLCGLLLLILIFLVPLSGGNATLSRAPVYLSSPLLVTVTTTRTGCGR